MVQKSKSAKAKLVAVKNRSKQYSHVQMKKLKTTAKRGSSAIKTIPGWLQSRPSAFREWKKEDKKKKKYRSFRLQKRIRPEPRYVPSAVDIIKASFKFLWQNKRLFIFIMIIHTALYVVAVRRPQTTSISTIQSALTEAAGGSDATGNLASSAATLGAVVGLSGASQANTATSSALILFMSLVYIWAIRQLHANLKIKARDAYYQAAGPVVGVVILLFILSVQLLPFAAASFVYSIARSGGLFASGFEDLAFFLVTALTALFSLYFVTSTIIALYIVTLPGTYPLRAMRAAKKLVQFQRLKVFQRILLLGLFVSCAYLLILLVGIKLLPNQVFIVAEALQVFAVPFMHICLYKLYRSLI